MSQGTSAAELRVVVAFENIGSVEVDTWSVSDANGKVEGANAG